MNTATLAVAGARKTQSIIDACGGGDESTRRLVVTYTLTGQRDLESRLRQTSPATMPDVCGWYSFLLRHWVRPFLPMLFEGRRLGGLNFDGLPATSPKGFVIATGADRFLDDQSRAYRRFLSKLALDVADAAGGAPTARLQRMYDEIYIDEVQDMTGFDLDVLQQLLETDIAVRLVGDLRQSVFDTNPQDPRHKKFRGLGMRDWFVEQEAAGRLCVEHVSTTWRSVQSVASFSDTLFDPSLDFPPTHSAQEMVSDHDGVFAIAPSDVATYVERYEPKCLRQTVATPVPDDMVGTNFGVSKGLTHNRVLVFTTAPMRAFLETGELLPDRSACGLYVGVTRAIYSVAFVTEHPERTSLPVWAP